MNQTNKENSQQIKYEDDALVFLGQDDLKDYFIAADSVTLFDSPPDLD